MTKPSRIFSNIIAFHCTLQRKMSLEFEKDGKMFTTAKRGKLSYKTPNMVRRKAEECSSLEMRKRGREKHEHTLILLLWLRWLALLYVIHISNYYAHYWLKHNENKLSRRSHQILQIKNNMNLPITIDVKRTFYSSSPYGSESEFCYLSASFLKYFDLASSNLCFLVRNVDRNGSL